MVIGKNMDIINLEGLTFSYGENKIIDDIDLSIEEGKITTILGANGCGKSTLFFLMTKELKPDKGKIYLNGKDIRDIGLNDFSKKVSIVQQNNNMISGISVRELVAFGRTPYKKLFRCNSKRDDELIDWAIEVTGIKAYEDRDISKLSGGQRQRVWIAMALAQDTKILFLDEPTTFLDIKYQLEILDLIKYLNENHCMTIIMVLHDINQAVYYSDQIVGLRRGKVEFSGSPQDIINEDSIEKIYGLKLKMVDIGDRKFVLTI